MNRSFSDLKCFEIGFHHNLHRNPFLLLLLEKAFSQTDPISQFLQDVHPVLNHLNLSG